MSSTASGRLKQYETLDTRDFVPFGGYDELSIENIKDVYEQFYKAPQGSCDILASDRGPSCTKIEQVKGKKVYCIRFLQPIVYSHCDVSCTATNTPIVKQARSAPATSLSKVAQLHERHAGVKTTVDHKSVFDVQKCCWSINRGSIKVEIEEKAFASGGFRDAYLAKCHD